MVVTQVVVVVVEEGRSGEVSGTVREKTDRTWLWMEAGDEGEDREDMRVSPPPYRPQVSSLSKWMDSAAVCRDRKHGAKSGSGLRS